MYRSSTRKSSSHLLSSTDEEAKLIIPLLRRDISIIISIKIQAGEIQISYPVGKLKALGLGLILHHKWKKKTLHFDCSYIFCFVSAASEISESSNKVKLKFHNFYLTNILIIFHTYFDTAMAMIQFSFFQIAFADRMLLLLQLSTNHD